MSVQAVIFDMDGLLLDSEDFWQQAEFEMFSSLGVPLQPGDTHKTLGWRCDDVVRYWYQQAPWLAPTQAEVAATIIDRVIAPSSTVADCYQAQSKPCSCVRRLDYR